MMFEKKEAKPVDDPFAALIAEKHRNSAAKRAKKMTSNERKSRAWVFTLMSGVAVGTAFYLFAWPVINDRLGDENPLVALQGLLEGETLVAVADERSQARPVIFAPEVPRYQPVNYVESHSAGMSSIILAQVDAVPAEQAKVMKVADQTAIISADPTAAVDVVQEAVVIAESVPVEPTETLFRTPTVYCST